MQVKGPSNPEKVAVCSEDELMGNSGEFHGLYSPWGRRAGHD